MNEVGVVIDPHPSHRAPQEQTDGIPFIGIGDVDEMGNINRDSARIVAESVYDEHHKRYDLSVPTLGLGRVASLGKVIRLRSDIGKYAVSPTMSILQFNENIDVDYIYAFMNSPEFKKQFEGKSNGSTRQSVGTEMVRVLDLSFPSNISEQNKIGLYFKNLDNLITLHQRNSADFVSRFFSDFTNTWEQRKLGEVGKARSGVGFPDTEQGGTIGVPFFKVSDMNLDGNENEMTVANNYVTAEQIAAHRWSPIEELPAIFFAKVGAAVMLNRKRLCRFPFLLDNNTMAYSLSSTEWDADFAKALFETIDLTSLVQVGALPSYNAGDVEAIVISMPSLSEQGQIGEFFKKLDNLITLHQCEYIFGK